MPIPKTKSVPVSDLYRKKILLHGQPKIGKTTVASQIPDAVFLATEPGLGSVEAFRWEDERGQYLIGDWNTLNQALDEVIAAKRFRMVVLDSLDAAFELCRDHVCREHGEKFHLDGKLSYGKGTAMINGELRRFLMRLANLDIGLLMLAHTIQEEVETRTGKTLRYVPNLPEKVRHPILAFVDLIGFCDFDIEAESGKLRRVIRTRPSPNWEAGDRTGKLPPTVALSWDSLFGAFHDAVKAGNSKQTA